MPRCNNCHIRVKRNFCLLLWVTTTTDCRIIVILSIYEMLVLNHTFTTAAAMAPSSKTM